MIEMLIVMLLLAIVTLFMTPFIQRILRRERLRSSVREVHSIVLSARMQAAKRGRQVIVFFDLPKHQVFSWADDLPYNYVRDNTEPLLANYQVPAYVYFRCAPFGAGVDSASAVSFDDYLGDTTRTDMIVFQADGSILNPQSSDSRRPRRPGSYTATVPSGSIDCNPSQRCRGIYMSDNTTAGDVADKNTFRISVDDYGSTGRVSLLKWIPTDQGGNPGEINYVPSPWIWAD